MKKISKTKPHASLDFLKKSDENQVFFLKCPNHNVRAKRAQKIAIFREIRSKIPLDQRFTIDFLRSLNVNSPLFLQGPGLLEFFEAQDRLAP